MLAKKPYQATAPTLGIGESGLRVPPCPLAH